MAADFDGGTFPDANLAVVPIRMASNCGGGTRFVVDVTINGVTLPTIVDTGSSGLRVLQQDVLEAGLEPIGDASIGIRYNGGQVLTGFTSEATVGLGGLSIDAVPIQVVTQVSNGAICDGGSASIYGYPAIMGIGLRASSSPAANIPRLRSPLAAVPGFPSFILRMNGSAGAAPPADDAGALVIGVPESEYAEFPFWVALAPQHAEGGAPDWNDLSVSSCIRDDTGGGGCWTQGTFIDTGDPTPYIEALDAGRPLPGEPLSAAGSAQIRILGPDQCVIDQYDVPASSVYVRKFDAGPTYNNVSYGVFFQMDVLYDPARGRMWFHPHT